MWLKPKSFQNSGSKSNWYNTVVFVIWGSLYLYIIYFFQNHQINVLSKGYDLQNYRKVDTLWSKYCPSLLPNELKTPIHALAGRVYIDDLSELYNFNNYVLRYCISLNYQGTHYLPIMLKSSVFCLCCQSNLLLANQREGRSIFCCLYRYIIKFWQCLSI